MVKDLRIAEGLGKELEIIPIQWEGLVPALQSNTIDAVITGMSPTEERRKEIDFTDSYYESHLVVVVQKGSDYADAKSLDDLEGGKNHCSIKYFPLHSY